MKIQKTPIQQPEDCAYIRTTNGAVIKLDKDDYERLKKYHWVVRKSYSRWYAMRKVTKDGKEFWIRMHREIMNTPQGMVTHHKNPRTLDNRKSNLVNMYQKDHHALHVTTFPGRMKVEKKNSDLLLTGLTNQE